MKKLFIVLTFFCSKSFCQSNSYQNFVKQAVEHYNNQIAAHEVMWGYRFDKSSERFSLDKDAGIVTVERGRSIVQFQIQILGTYDWKDSTFLWSIDNDTQYQKLTRPVQKLKLVSEKNKWNIFPGRAIKCKYEKAKELTTLAFFIDNANGMETVLTNMKRTTVFYAFYEVKIIDRMFKAFRYTVPNKSQYYLINDNGLIEICKKYLDEFAESERSFYTLYGSNKELKYLDSLRQYRRRVSDKYWDTTSLAYIYHGENRNRDVLQNDYNWRVLRLDDEKKYVVFNDRKTWGGIKIYVFELAYVDGKPKITNEFETYGL